MDGVHLFGKMAAATQCTVLNAAGWSVAAAVALNTVFAVASLWLWWSFFRLMGFRERWIAAFILLLGVTEAMVGMVEKGRYEFLCFFLLSAALWLAAQRRETFAALVAMIAVETEPAAVVIPIAVALLLFARTKNPRLLTMKLGLAAAVAIGVYVGLHPGAIQEIARTNYSVRQPGYIHLSESASQSSFGSYFIKRKRHLPELAMILLGGLLYWKHRREIADRGGAWCALLLGAIYLLPLHANANYMVLAMPFFLWAALEGYDRDRRWLWVPACVFACMVMQYAYLYRLNAREGFTSQDARAVGTRINELASAADIPDDRLNICGDFSQWFAHPRNYRNCNFDREALDLKNLLTGSDLFLCFDGPLQTNAPIFPARACSELKKVIPLRELSSMEVEGHSLHFLSH